MALFNEILTGRHNRLLQKLFALKGAPPAPQLASEISISQPIFHGIENRFIESWNVYGCFGNVAPVAVTNSNFQMRNPLNSGLVAVIECLVFNAAAGAVDLQYGQGASSIIAGGVLLPTRSRDGRNKGASGIEVSTGNINAGQVGQTLIRFGTQTSISIIFPLSADQQIVLSPGDSVRLQDTTQNDTMNVSALWRERALEESERA
jgi:hypothetical protein